MNGNHIPPSVVQERFALADDCNRLFEFARLHNWVPVEILIPTAKRQIIGQYINLTPMHGCDIRYANVPGVTMISHSEVRP